LKAGIGMGREVLKTLAVTSLIGNPQKDAMAYAKDTLLMNMLPSMSMAYLREIYADSNGK
jgi:hypothetical protein